MTITRTCSLAGATLVLALGAGACGGSDEQDARATATQWLTLDHKKHAKRTCELMTPRAQSQFIGLLGSFAGSSGGCVGLFGKTEPSDDSPSARDVAKGKLTIRGDRALLSFAGEEMPMGLRKVDGEWRVDNVINASLDERPRRVDPRLGQGSDEQQVRATYRALSEAMAGKDYERSCSLFGYAAEAQLVLGRAFASFGETEKSKTMPDLSCAASMRALAKLADGDDADLAFTGEVPSAAALAAARVSIRGARATVRVKGEDPGHFVREEGHWRVGAEPSEGFTTEAAPSAAALERCWRRAGASIASDAGDVRFAVGSTARNVKISPGRVSAKGKEWRIFYTLPSDGEDPGLATVLAKPSTVSAVAYVQDAPAHTGVVEKARACGG